MIKKWLLLRDIGEVGTSLGLISVVLKGKSS